MARRSTVSIHQLIRPTDTGVKVDLKAVYVYPDGHANLTFQDGTNWPLADQYEVIEALAGLLGRMEKAAVANARNNARP